MQIIHCVCVCVCVGIVRMNDGYGLIMIVYQLERCCNKGVYWKILHAQRRTNEKNAAPPTETFYVKCDVTLAIKQKMAQRIARSHFGSMTLWRYALCGRSEKLCAARYLLCKLWNELRTFGVLCLSTLWE